MKAPTSVVLRSALLAVFYMTWISGIRGEPCIDVITKKSCLLLAKYDTCKSNAARMYKLCRKTCNLCHWLTECSTVKCPDKHICLVDDNETAYCKCTVKCKANDNRTGPVCARNGKTYDSVCSMKMDQCKEKMEIKVYHYGHCINLDSCVDFETNQCRSLAKKNLCLTSSHLMQFYCAATCRLCRQPAPQPMCYKSRHGCCWNSEKAATGPNQKGCKACKERRFCTSFRDLCSKHSSIGIMRQLCPKTCGYC